MKKIIVTISRLLEDEYLPELLKDPIEYVDCDLFEFFDDETTKIERVEVENDNS
jgi:hypothetical protein